MPPAKKASARGSTQKYIRNVRYVPVGVRLGTGRRINLQPRGQRGDCAPVSKEEMSDEIFLGNVGLLFEVIPVGEAQDVIGKQTTNQQQVHPALHQLRNAKGEGYTRGVVVEENFDDQGKTVAAISDRGMIERFKAPGTVDQPLPDIPADVPPEEVADWVARQKNIEGPEAGLAGLKVVKEPTTTKEN